MSPWLILGLGVVYAVVDVIHKESLTRGSMHAGIAIGTAFIESIRSRHDPAAVNAPICDACNGRYKHTFRYDRWLIIWSLVAIGIAASTLVPPFDQSARAPIVVFAGAMFFFVLGLRALREIKDPRSIELRARRGNFEIYFQSDVYAKEFRKLNGEPA